MTLHPTCCSCCDQVQQIRGVVEAAREFMAHSVGEGDRYYALSFALVALDTTTDPKP